MIPFQSFPGTFQVLLTKPCVKIFNLLYMVYYHDATHRDILFLVAWACILLIMESYYSGHKVVHLSLRGVRSLVVSVIAARLSLQGALATKQSHPECSGQTPQS